MAENMGSQVLRIALLFGAIAVILSSTAGCGNKESKVPYYNTPDFTPYWLSDVPDNIHRVGAFKVTDQFGNEIDNSSFNDKLYVANFFFTSCPSICPTMMKNMKTVADNFKNEERVKFISYSVDPERDSVTRLKLYAERYHINNDQWHLVTGNKSGIYSLARTSYFAEEEIGYNKDSTEFLHTEHFILVDRAGRLRGIYNGTLTLEMQRLQEDINILLNEW